MHKHAPTPRSHRHGKARLRSSQGGSQTYQLLPLQLRAEPGLQLYLSLQAFLFLVSGSRRCFLQFLINQSEAHPQKSKISTVEEKVLLKHIIKPYIQ